MSGQNYARGVPMGNNQMPASFDAPPAVKAVVSRMSENANVSSVITLSQNTTAIEVAVTGTNVPALLRWIATATTDPSVFGNASIMNYDHVIPPNVVRRFVVPIEVNKAGGYSSQMGANIENGLFQRFAWKTQGIASVYSNEYGSSSSY